MRLFKAAKASPHAKFYNLNTAYSEHSEKYKTVGRERQGRYVGVYAAPLIN